MSSGKVAMAAACFPQEDVQVSAGVFQFESCLLFFSPHCPGLALGFPDRPGTTATARSEDVGLP